MNMGSGDVGSSVTDLPLSDPACVKAAEACTAFYAAENTSQAAVPWASQFLYGHYVTYYWVVIVGLLAIFHYLCVVCDHKSWPISRSRRKSVSLLMRARAVCRYIFYRQPSGIWRFLMPSAGMTIFLVVTLVFLTALVFTQRPYYRQHLGFGSPPIAIRSGLMAYACIPILIALAGKANIITLFTGISHEKLNVVHRWVAWMSFGLSLFHSLPYFIASYRDYGFGGYARVKYEFYRSLGPTYEFSGVPPVAVLFGLCILSLPQIRHRLYESFYVVHILLAITYLGLCFWHGGNTIDSWAYLWPTVAIWLASWLARAFWFTQPLNIKSQWFTGSPATLTLFPGSATRIEVWPPTDFSWTPGQHTFLRFPSFAPLENHPFTIVSVPNSCPIRAAKKEGSFDESSPPLVFIARTHDGFTGKLAAQAGKVSPGLTSSVWLEGPYGGIKRPIENICETLLLVAGGTGITACMPWLLYVVAKAKVSGPIRIKRLVLVWSIRSSKSLSWVEEELTSIRGVNEVGVEIVCKFHVTGSRAAPSNDTGSKEGPLPESENDLEIGVSPDSDKVEETEDSESVYLRRIASLGTCISGRPHMAEVLNNIIGDGVKAMVIGCGPETFMIDLGNAVASAQKRVMTGDCKEVAMHLETFGW